MNDAPTAKQAEADQESKDVAQAKAMRRRPLDRHPGESDFLYARRLSRTLTEDQIKLAHDMHAIHAAQASGFVLPPLPVTDEQKAIDAERAKELGLKPIERDPGETDAEFDARLALSELIAAAPAGPLGGPPMTQSRFDNLPREPGETDAAYEARNSANQSRIRAERDLATSGVTAAPSFAPPPGVPGTTYPSHVDAPAPQPDALGGAR
jgi:hypothetical protein